MVEHPIDDDSGYGHIQPYRKGPTGDTPVLGESFPQSEIERYQGEREDRSGEDDMGNQNSKVDETNPPTPFKRG